MFGSIGITELIFIAGIALVFLGPEKFPEMAKIAARTIRDLRGYMDEAKRDIGEGLKPIQQEVKKLSQIDPEDYIEKLAGSSDDNGRDDAEGTGADSEWDEDAYNPEPHPEDMGFGAGAEIPEEEVELTPDERETEDTFQYDSYAGPTKDAKSESADAEEGPEHLDG